MPLDWLEIGLNSVGFASSKAGRFSALIRLLICIAGAAFFLFVLYVVVASEPLSFGFKKLLQVSGAILLSLVSLLAVRMSWLHVVHAGKAAVTITDAGIELPLLVDRTVAWPDIIGAELRHNCEGTPYCCIVLGSHSLYRPTSWLFRRAKCLALPAENPGQLVADLSQHPNFTGRSHAI